MCTLCVPGGHRGQKGASEDDWNYRRGSWELNLSPLEEQVLLFAEPPVTFLNSCRAYLFNLGIHGQYLNLSFIASLI